MASLRGEHDSRQPAAILEEQVAVGSHQEYRDGALGHRQAAVFSVVGTSQSRGDPEDQQADGQQ